MYGLVRRAITQCLHLFGLDFQLLGRFFPVGYRLPSISRRNGTQKVKCLREKILPVRKNILPLNCLESDLIETENRSGRTFLSVYKNNSDSRMAIYEISDAILHVHVSPYGDQFFSIVLPSGEFLSSEGLSSFPAILLQESLRRRGRLKCDRIESLMFGMELWANNYFHWIVRIFPRIAQAKNYFGKDVPEILVSKPVDRTRSTIYDSLSYLGVESSKFRELDAGVYEIGTLYFSYVSLFNPVALSDTRCRFLKDDNLSKAANLKLYVSRKNAEKRKISNEPMLVDRLRRMGFTVVYPEFLSFAKQIELFSQAHVICSAHGAGLTNMIFMQENSSVIEVVNTDDPSPEFYSLSLAMGHNYFIVEGTSENPENAPGQSDIKVDFELVIDAVQQAVPKSSS